MEKEDFRIVQTDADKFHIQRLVVEITYTWWGKRKETLKWMMCNSEGRIYVWRSTGNTYWRPAREKPFDTLEDAQRQIEKIIDKDNNYPKIYAPR